MKNKIIYGVFLIFIIAIIIFRIIARPYHVSGDCMEPAIKHGQLYFLNKLVPYIGKYKINDIIMFKYENKDWIARIVALENDSIEINEGNIIVNGLILQDNIKRNWNDWKYGTFAIENSIKVPQNHVYVLSDNLSAHHDDSRVFGPISTSEIIGTVW